MICCLLPPRWQSNWDASGFFSGLYKLPGMKGSLHLHQAPEESISQICREASDKLCATSSSNGREERIWLTRAIAYADPQTPPSTMTPNGPTDMLVLWEIMQLIPPKGPLSCRPWTGTNLGTYCVCGYYYNGQKWILWDNPGWMSLAKHRESLKDTRAAWIIWRYNWNILIQLLSYIKWSQIKERGVFQERSKTPTCI